MPFDKNNPKHSHSDDHHSETPHGATDLKLSKGLGLSRTEFEHYKEYDVLTHNKITGLLKERHDLNYFVKMHLGEKINPNQQFRTLIQWVFPTENVLSYALQKVDDIEYRINELLRSEHKPKLFYDNTTKKHRLEILLAVALDYKSVLVHEIAAAPKKSNLQHKLKNLTVIINEFKDELKNNRFTIQNPELSAINDPDLNYFLSKLKLIGISGLSEPVITKNYSSFFKVKIISTLYERFYPEQHTPDNDANNDDDPDNNNRHKP